MKHRYKFLLGIVLSPIIALAFYIAFLWITYIDETIVSGEKYGFRVGASKEEVFQNVLLQQKEHPSLFLYLNHGDRAGDYIEVQPNSISLLEVKNHKVWTLLYDGKGEYFNILRLKFDHARLAMIYRHRKYFELP